MLSVKKVRSLSLFSNFTDTELSMLAGKINMPVRRFRKEEILLHQGDNYDTLYMIAEGVCQGEMLDLSGKAVRIEDLPSPYLIAPGVLFSRENTLPVTVKAKTDVEAVLISKKDIYSLCRNSEKFLQNFLQEISDKVSFLSKRLYFMSFKSIKAKIAHFLLQQARFKDRIILPDTMEELASFFGVERPSLSRAFGEMEKERIIKKVKREVVILNKDKLVRISR